MLELFISALVTFFVVIDPPGCVPIYASLTSGADVVQRRAMAMRAVAVAGLVLLFFALGGEPFLKALGISLDSFRIAGGAMLFLIAIDMVFEKRTERREHRAEEVQRAHTEDVSIFPMAIPMIAGPGAIASVMLLTAQAQTTIADVVVLAALLVNLLLMLAGLLMAGPIMRKLGKQVEAMITRLLGLILAALAVQYLIDGVRGSFLL